MMFNADNYSIKALSIIEEAISRSSNQEEAIEISSYYGSFVTVNHCPLYDGGNLELKFIERFANSLPRPESLPLKDSIHVISTAYVTGGHTRLMERLAGMHKNAPDLLITCRSEIEYEINESIRIFNSVFDLSTVSEAIKLKTSILLLSQYNNVILHIHPDDFTSAVAARFAKTNGLTKVFFVNHADHLFSFGRSASDRVLEVSAFGEALGKIHCPGLISSFIGIPIPLKWGQIKDTANPFGKTSVLVSGSFWKFRPELGYSLPLILRKVLEGNKKIYLTLIGVRPIKDYWWWSIKLCFPMRVKLVKSVPFEQYKKILDAHSFVVDSFPVTGGTAFPEAFLAGKIAIGLQGPVSGYTPMDRLRVTDYQAIQSIIENSDSYIKTIENMKNEMEYVHSTEQVKKRYLSALAGRGSSNLLLPNFHGDPLFFEKCSDKHGRINMPRRDMNGNVLLTLVELRIFFKYFNHLCYGDLQIILSNLLRNLIFKVGKLNA